MQEIILICINIFKTIIDNCNNNNISYYQIRGIILYIYNIS